WLRKRTNYVAVYPVQWFAESLFECLAVYSDTVEVKKRFQLAKNGAHAAGGVEILHVTVANRLQIDEDGGLVRDFVEAFKRNPNAQASSDGGQVDDGIGGSA